MIFGMPEQHLRQIDPDWMRLIHQVGPCTLQQSGHEPWVALMRAIAYQQIHGRAAEAILGRFLALFPDQDFPSPEDVLATSAETLRACGFSANKSATLLGIAEAAASGLIPSRQDAESLSDAELIARLTTLRGVGRWTVEILLMFTLARPDILPVDDFGVREGWRVLKGLPEQPKPKALAGIAQPWQPWRSTAAWYLWRAADRARQGTLV